MRFFVLAAFIFPAAMAEAQDGAGIVRLIQKANAQCTRSATACSPARDPLPVEPLDVERRTIKDKLGRDLPVSVIGVGSLRRLRELYPANLRIYDPIVCSQRAHIIGETLAKAGIETQKLLVYPGGTVVKGKIVPDDRVRTSDGKLPAWDYHVVNLIYVKNHAGQIEPYVIDPFMEGLPVPRTAWEKRLRTDPQSSVGTVSVISRYNFGPYRGWLGLRSDEDKAISQYDPDLLKRSYEIMRGEPKRY
jgi:hypothetical protein